MKTAKFGFAALLLVGSLIALGGCADDPYSRGYSSFSVGVSSGGGYGYHRHGYWRDGYYYRY